MISPNNQTAQTVLADFGMSKDIKTHRDEYLFLRKEIMLRTAWHLDFTRNAITTSLYIWVGGFAVISHFWDKEFFSVPFNLSIFVLWFPILMLYTQSFKVYENYTNFCNIGAYLIKFHEKPIHDNNDNFFSWETAHAYLLKHFQENRSNTIKAMNNSNNEMALLSGLSWLLFASFSGLCLHGWYANGGGFDWGICVITTVIIAALAIGAVLTHKTYRRTSYKCLDELSAAARKTWEHYAAAAETER